MTTSPLITTAASLWHQLSGLAPNKVPLVGSSSQNLLPCSDTSNISIPQSQASLSRQAPTPPLSWGLGWLLLLSRNLLWIFQPPETPVSTFLAVLRSGTEHYSSARLYSACPESGIGPHGQPAGSSYSTEEQVSLWGQSPTGTREKERAKRRRSLGWGQSAGTFDLGDPEVWVGGVLLGRDY